jgi:tRNA(Arg) A34 adenosine deaminase TadA
MSAMDTELLRKVIAIAREARRLGNHPFGALLAVEGKELLVAPNTVITERDVTRHAELNLVARASRQLTPEILAQSTMYCSTEPCAMCAGAIYWAGIRKVVYALSSASLARLTGGSLLIPCREIFARGASPTEVTGPLLEAEAAVVHEGFWTKSP